MAFPQFFFSGHFLNTDLKNCTNITSANSFRFKQKTGSTFTAYKILFSCCIEVKFYRQMYNQIIDLVISLKKDEGIKSYGNFCGSGRKRGLLAEIGNLGLGCSRWIWMWGISFGAYFWVYDVMDGLGFQFFFGFYRTKDMISN